MVRNWDDGQAWICYLLFYSINRVGIACSQFFVNIGLALLLLLYLAYIIGVLHGSVP